MKLTHGCIITKEVKLLTEFYQNILQIQGQVYEEDYVEFEVGHGVLAIFDFNSLERLAPGSMQPASNKSVILEFHVEDVDKEYERLKKLNVDWVKPPTTQPWGNRSIYFSDPDGNMINFYSCIK